MTARRKRPKNDQRDCVNRRFGTEKVICFRRNPSQLTIPRKKVLRSRMSSQASITLRSRSLKSGEPTHRAIKKTRTQPINEWLRASNFLDTFHDVPVLFLPEPGHLRNDFRGMLKIGIDHNAGYSTRVSESGADGGFLPKIPTEP